MTQDNDRPEDPTDQTSADMATDKPQQTGADTPDATTGPALPILRLGPDMARAGSEHGAEASAETDAETTQDAEPAPLAPEDTAPDPADDCAADSNTDSADAAPEEDRAESLTDNTDAETEVARSAEPDSPALQLPDAPEEAPSEDTPPEDTGPDLWAATSEEELAKQSPERIAEDIDAPDTLTAPVPPPVAPRPRPACAAALFGKLPTRGDFIARNMPRAVQRPFEDWLIPLVQEARSELGAQWSTIWRGAGPWRFWIGADVLGGSWQRDLRKPAHEQAGIGGAMTGVLLPSADRHGRDFPLVLLLADPLARLMPPPVTTSPDRGWYDLCDELLYAARGGAEIGAVEAALDRLPGPLLPEGAEDMAALLDQRALWAQGTETLADGTSRIWPDIAQADHHLAANHRSYWWQAPRAGAAQRVLTLAGLPDAGSFAFMLSQGYPEAPDPTPDPITAPDFDSDSGPAPTI